MLVVYRIWLENLDNQKLALIFGVTGQDGSYLSDFLLDKGYRVVGVKRRSSTNTTWRVDHLKDTENFSVIEGDITDPSSVTSIINEYQPTECYNTSAQSHVHTSFEQPSYTFQVNTLGVLNILEAIRHNSKHTRLVQCSTSEMFGNNADVYNDVENHNDSNVVKYQSEDTKLNPVSPYGVSKVASHHLVSIYRDAYDLHASCAISYNHESPRRGEEFVTRKITKWIGEFESWRMVGRKSNINLRYDNFDTMTVPSHIYYGMDCFPKLRLGNLDAKRDWGHAWDVVRGVWLMAQKDQPDDYILSTVTATGAPLKIIPNINLINLN